MTDARFAEIERCVKSDTPLDPETVIELFRELKRIREEARVRTSLRKVRGGDVEW